MPYSVVLTMPCSYIITMPYSYDIRIGILAYTPILYFCDFTVTSVTIGLKYLIYNVLSGGRRGDRSDSKRRKIAKIAVKTLKNEA